MSPWLTELTVSIAATTGGSYCKDMLPPFILEVNFKLQQKHNCDPEKVESKAVSSIFMAADWLEFRPPAALVCSHALQAETPDSNRGSGCFPLPLSLGMSADAHHT